MLPEIVEAIIFDLDGTLVHTKPEYRYLVVGEALRKSDRSAPQSQIDDFWFGSEDERTRIIQEKWHLSPEGQFWPAFRDLDTIELRRQYTEVYPDVGLLQVLKERGVKTGIVSAAPDHIIELEIGMLNHSFGSVVRAQLVKGVKPKPSPEGLLKCIGELGVNASKTIYVGDTKTDMETARSAKVYGVLIERGEYDFGKVEADLTITSLKSLGILF